MLALSAARSMRGGGGARDSRGVMVIVGSRGGMCGGRCNVAGAVVIVCVVGMSKMSYLGVISWVCCRMHSKSSVVLTRQEKAKSGE